MDEHVSVNIRIISSNRWRKEGKNFLWWLFLSLKWWWNWKSVGGGSARSLGPPQLPRAAGLAHEQRTRERDGGRRSGGGRIWGIE
jgi:hypothetical protein